MRLEEIRIGGAYRVRSQEDLAAEFGVKRYPNELAYIGTPVPFPEKYWYICGQTFTVRQKGIITSRQDREMFICLSEERVEVLPDMDGFCYVIAVTPEMLEPLDGLREDKMEGFTPESLMEFLTG